MASKMTPDVQKQLYAETDARFAAKTGIARKLDPGNPIDQAYQPVWMHLYNDVKTQFLKGTIVWTYNHPAVAPLLAQAQAMTTAAATGLDASQKATTQTDQAAHVADAHAALAASTAATQAVKQTIQDLIASESPAAAAVASGIADAALGQKIAAASQNVVSDVAAGKRVAGDAGDVVTAMQGAGASQHASPSAASPSEPATLQHAPAPFTAKTALGIGAAVGFLGLVALATSKANTPKRHRSSSRRTTIVQYRRARRR